MGTAGAWQGEFAAALIHDDAMRGDLPTGTVTFLFTDVEGSTKLLHELGANAYAQALADHRLILRAAFSAHGGVEVDTQGDAFFVAFPTASGALRAAADAVERLASGPICVRIGIHTGTPLLTDEGYVGVDVHRAARIAASGHGGQVLVSSSAAPLVGADELRNLGEHRLKDLSAPERIYQLGGKDFPPLKSLYRTNLPIPATPFLGREHELAEVRGLLEDARLLTLSGPGGTGKTRLGLQAAAEAADRYPDGIFWVPLAPLRDPELVLATAGQALGAENGLAEHLADKSLLLLFDNFEHVVDAAPGLSELLSSCPNVRLLVTSRELLRVPGEQVYPVPPLEPQDGAELFLARARAALPSFVASGAVPDLCARLENLPLALELAAARVRVLSPEQLLERLSQRLDLLRAGRGVDPRQQTLRATIEWSHELLSEDEQRLFARLAVFAGGCTLESAEAVCDAELDTLESLVDKSLVRVREGARFWMLETIREYGAERLEASGEAEAVRRRHAEFFLRVAESTCLSVERIQEGTMRYDLALAEQDNMRAALNWALDADPELGLRIAVELEQFWISKDPSEGMRRLAVLYDRASDIPLELRAAVLRVFGGTAQVSGDQKAAQELYEASLATYERVGDEWGVIHLRHRLATLAVNFDDWHLARSLTEENLIRSRALGSRFLEAEAVGMLGTLESHDGNVDRAIQLTWRHVVLSREIGFIWFEAGGLTELGELSLKLGRPAEAEEHARAALELFRTMDDRRRGLLTIALLAAAARAQGDVARASRLWGAVESEQAQSPPSPAVKQYIDGFEERALREPWPELEAGLETGRRLSWDEAVEYALGASDA